MTNSTHLRCLALLLGLSGAGCGVDGRSPTAPSTAGLQETSAAYTVTASAQTVTVGDQLSVSWSAPSTYPDGQGDGHADWVALFKVGASSYDEPWWRTTRMAQTQGHSRSARPLSLPVRVPLSAERRACRLGAQQP
jgi:hypothetical protein